MPSKPKILIEWSAPTKVQTKYGAKWVRWWVIPKDYVEGFRAFWGRDTKKLRAQGYSLTKNRLGKWTLNEWQKYKADFREEFGQNNAKIELKIKTESTLHPYVVKNTTGLREFQPPIVAKICAALKANNAALDGSDTGAGKTYTAVAAARELGLKIAVICPKAVITAWKKVIVGHFGMEAKCVLNYEAVKTGKYKDVGVWKPVSKISTRKNFQWTLPKDTLIIFDESHRLKGDGTKNSKMGMSAKRQGYRILCCSATNAINPIELKCVGFILGLYKSGKWTQFLRDHDCDKGRFGWEFGGSRDVLKKLNADIFLDKGVRVRREDIKGFPDCDTTAEAYNMDEKSEKELNSVYKDMERELKILKTKAKNTKEYKVNSFVIMLRARQLAEIIKVPLFVEMAEDALADGMSVAIFVNFSETVRALSKRLNTNCVVWGENKGDERDIHIADFQSDKKREIIVNVKAGGSGLSLHDLNGNFPRLALISPTPSAIDLRQALGRIWRDGGKTKSLQKLVFVANTVEEDVCDKVKLKLDNLDTINDGDLQDFMGGFG